MKERLNIFYEKLQSLTLGAKMLLKVVRFEKMKKLINKEAQAGVMNYIILCIL